MTQNELYVFVALPGGLVLAAYLALKLQSIWLKKERSNGKK